jgi:hypothetical protein
MTIDRDRIRRIKQALDPVSIAERYTQPQRSGSDYTARCPIHDDKDASFHIYAGQREGRPYHCFGCSWTGDVIDLVRAKENLSLPDALDRLEREAGTAPIAPAKKRPDPLPDADAWVPVLPVPDEACRLLVDDHQTVPIYNPRNGKLEVIRPARSWFYVDAECRILGCVLRIELRDGRKMTPTITWCRKAGVDQGRWCMVGFPRPRPLLGLDHLASEPEAPVLVVEGEKKVTAAHSLVPTMVPVCAPNGAQSAGAADWSSLAGRQVWLWPDYDQPGLAFVRKAAGLIAAAGGHVQGIVDLDLVAAALGRTLEKGWDLADLPVDEYATLLPTPESLPALCLPWLDPQHQTPASIPASVGDNQTPEAPPPRTDATDPVPEPTPGPADPLTDDDGRPLPTEPPPGDGTPPPPPSAPAASSEPEKESSGQYHRKVRSGLIEFLNSQQLRPDALDGWMHGTVRSRLMLADVVLAFLNRTRERYRISRSYAEETLSAVVKDWRTERWNSLVAAACRTPGTPAGREALRAWIRAVVIDRPAEADGLGTRDLAELAVLHWLRNTKRMAIGLRAEHDLMPVLFSTAQGSGKTTAVERLCSPLAELAIQVDASYLTDDRRIPVLSRAVIGRWEEMQGSNRADIEKLKNTVTSPTIDFRPMRSNDTVILARTCSFIGTSNLPVDTLVADTTGARRFFQIDAPPVCDWDAINGIDYAVLWSAIGVDDPSPLIPHLGDLRKHQEHLVHRDPVSLWLEAETWERVAVMRSDVSTPDIWLDYDPAHGATLEELGARFQLWARGIGQAPIGSKTLAQRLRQEGFDKPWLPARTTGRYRRAYAIPPQYLKPVSTIVAQEAPF